MLTDRLDVPYEYVHSASKADATKFGLETRKVDETVEAFNRGVVKVLIGTSCIATGTNIYCTHTKCIYCTCFFVVCIKKRFILYRKYIF